MKKKNAKNGKRSGAISATMMPPIEMIRMGILVVLHLIKVVVIVPAVVEETNVDLDLGEIFFCTSK